MAAAVDSLISTLRGMVVDRDDGEVTPAFTDPEIIAAINVIKDAFFSMRPEAFATSLAQPSTPPADVEDDEDDLAIAGWAVRQFLSGVAAHLLSQQSKDEFYRKAAETMRRIYLGG